MTFQYSKPARTDKVRQLKETEDAINDLGDGGGDDGDSGALGFDLDPDTTSGLTLGIKAGSFRGNSGQVYTVAPGTIDLADFSADQYVYLVTDDVAHMGEYRVSSPFGADTHGLTLYKVSTDNGAIVGDPQDLRATLTAPQPRLTSESITSGASPVAADPDIPITILTTGETTDVEEVTLADPANPASPVFKTFLVIFSDGDDKPQINIATVANNIVSPLTLVPNNGATQVIQLVWNPSIPSWQAIVGGTIYVSSNQDIMLFQNSGIIISDGGPFIMQGGGGMELRDTTSFSTNGVVRHTNLPTSDPHDAGRLYLSSGTVKVSAG